MDAFNEDAKDTGVVGRGKVGNLEARKDFRGVSKIGAEGNGRTPDGERTAGDRNGQRWKRWSADLVKSEVRGELDVHGRMGVGG